MPMKRSIMVVAAFSCAAGLVRAQVGPDPRTDVSKKGSLLVYPAVEIEWNAAGEVVLDTIFTITNDYFDEVRVQLYYVNGDAPRDAIIAGDPPVIISDAEPGWNFADCEFTLTADQSLFWSLATGSPQGCQPFAVIDPDGRPDPDGITGRRVLRGFVLAWAVDAEGREIKWNHLSGGATTIDYELTSAWEYGPYAFAANSLDHGQQTDDRPGQLILNGREYDAPYDVLILTFDAAGASHSTGNGITVSSDTDLTLHLIEADLRDENFGLVNTLVRYDIWNMNERRFSGTQHPLTCWHQRLFSDLGLPNNFLRSVLQTDRGKTRIHGLPQEDCSPRFLPAAVLGVARTKLAFSGQTSGQESTSETLIGSGCEEAAILYDLHQAVPPSLRPPRTKPGFDRIRDDRISGKPSDRDEKGR